MASRPNAVSRIVGSVVNPVVGAVEFDEVLEKVDLDALLEKIDIDHLLDRIDVDKIVQRIDLDALVQRIDLDALVQRIDIPAVVQQANVRGIMASTATSGLQVIRRRLQVLDGHTRDKTRHLLGREPIEDETDRTAGPWSRGPAYLIDAAIVSVVFSGAIAVGTYLLSRFLGREIEAEAGAIWFTIAFAAWTTAYYWLSVALAGQTVGKAILGVRVVRDDGERLGVGAALVRVLVFPFSFLFFGLGFVGIIFGRRHRALHDVATGGIVVYVEPGGT